MSFLTSRLKNGDLAKTVQSIGQELLKTQHDISDLNDYQLLGIAYIHQVFCLLKRQPQTRSDQNLSGIKNTALMNFFVGIEKYVNEQANGHDVTFELINYMNTHPIPKEGDKRKAYIQQIVDQFNLPPEDAERFVISKVMGLPSVMDKNVFGVLTYTLQSLKESKIKPNQFLQSMAVYLKNQQEFSPEITRIPLSSGMTMEQFLRNFAFLPSHSLEILGARWAQKGLVTCATIPDGVYTMEKPELPMLEK